MNKTIYRSIAFFMGIVGLVIFVGCATTGIRYAEPSPKRHLTFPRDHAAHKDFQTEWWYFTGHLELTDGTDTGFELVFFRRRTEKDHRWGIPVRWIANPMYFAHFAITDPSKNRFVYAEEKGKRPAGGAKTDRMFVWSDGWMACMSKDGSIPLSYSMSDYSVDLVLKSEKPPVVDGENGISRKGENGGEGYYYSYTRLDVKGFLKRGKKYIKIKKGVAWMDHEFFSLDLAKNLAGWDWFSVQLDDGTDLMAFLLHRADGSIDIYSSGTLVRPDGSLYRFLRDDFLVTELNHWYSHKTHATYPVRWRIVVPRESMDLKLDAVMPQQELITKYTHINYWEGEMVVSGARGGKKVSGKAYVEMTGRDKPINK